MASAPNLTLRHFLLKQQVLDLYRNAIRASRAIQDPVTRRETLVWIRSEIEHSRHITDVTLIEDKLKLGRRDLKAILPTVQ
ncbi:hypothetical protein L208DRAFT_1307914 [Tricholoma matsutake]|nr:hypothetical protein L208DRAFT_1307914 [Tricholoma matsutake 945]